MLLMDVPGGTNASSRYAALKALVEEGRFAINSYVGDTADWALTPEGRYYSNKAPGPVLLAYPLFWLWDGVTTRWWLADRAEREARRKFLQFTALKILSLVLQVIPFALLVGWAASRLRAPPVVWGVLLLGNTGVLFLNVFFGHGMAALFVLATVLALWGGHDFRAGAALGAAVLCDYGAALLVLPVLLWAAPRGRAGAVVAGGAGPLAVFALYHTACFGAPWALPMRFQNPEFVDVGPGGLWGVLNGLPRGGVLVELLVGPSRGLLWTHPWVLVAAVFWRKNPLLFWSVVGLGLLLAMNAAFGAWHGGHSSGPRYLSPVLPALALGWISLWTHLGRGWRPAFVAVSALSIAIHLGIFVSGVMLPPGEALWEGVGRHLWSPTAFARGLALGVVVMGARFIRLSAIPLRRPA